MSSGKTISYCLRISIELLVLLIIHYTCVLLQTQTLGVEGDDFIFSRGKTRCSRPSLGQIFFCWFRNNNKISGRCLLIINFHKFVADNFVSSTNNEMDKVDYCNRTAMEIKYNIVTKFEFELPQKHFNANTSQLGGLRILFSYLKIKQQTLSFW